PLELQNPRSEPTQLVEFVSAKTVANSSRQAKSFKPFVLFFCILALVVAVLISLVQPTGKVAADPPPPLPQPTIPRGVSQDLWADTVIGQPDFATVAFNETTDHKLFWVNGVIAYTDTLHPENNTLFVYDAGNN